MLVSEIFEDVKEVIGYCSESKIFSRLSDSVETLSNKGQWDSLLTYLNIASTGDNDVIVLPPEVDSVLRININGNPSFARDRLWEFTLDGPGSNDERIGFQWEDRGDVTVITNNQSTNTTTFTPTGIQQPSAQLPATALIPPYMLPRGSYGLEFPLRVTIFSRDLTPGAFIIYTLDGSDPDFDNGIQGLRTVSLTITTDTTVKAVTAVRGPRPGEDQLSEIVEEFYSELIGPPDPPPPPPPGGGGGSMFQRIIRLSKRAVAVRALVRLKPKTITSKDDWIPLDSKMSILLMVKALESYRRGTPNDFQLGQAQEAQALKFLQEEQQSRNVFSDIAKQMDTPPLVGYLYHANNMVVVADIYDEAAEICGGVGKDHVLDKISEAIEVLSNKGQWDGMTAYLDMVPSSDVIGLPRQVEIPLKINIETKPSISRSRMFEFSTNGPGTDLDEVTTLTWEDQGDTPLMVPLPAPSIVNCGGIGADAGKKVTFYGIDKEDKEQTLTLTIPANESLQVSKPIVWKTITRISKETTLGPVFIYANFSVIALLYPDQTESSFRKIKLNKKADAIKVMFRKASLKVSSTDDLIPLKSRSAILLMLKSLQMMKKSSEPGAIQVAQQLEAQALKFLQEEESSKLGYISASAKDLMPAIGSNLNSAQGVLLAADVYDDAADIFGPIGRQRLFDKITEAREMLANKAQWDGLDGYVDIVADQKGYMTLPRKVEVPIGMNFWRTPAQMRNKWYEFHMNGLGTDPVMGNYLDDLGEYPIINEPTQPLRLFATTNNTHDGGLQMRAYGYNNTGQWIRSVENGEYVDGELVPINVLVPTLPHANQTFHTTSNEFRQISRVTKEVTETPLTLFATGSLIILPPGSTQDPPNPQLLGIYDTDETEPMFRRVRIPTGVTWVRMRYRTRTFKITKMSDPVNMKSKTALVTMMKALDALSKGDINAYQGFEAVAVKLISDEQSSRNPSETFTLQYDTDTCFADPLQGRY